MSTEQAPGGQEEGCDLCRLPLPRKPYRLETAGGERRFCCLGCRHVYQLLAESGQLTGDPRESELFRRCRELGIIRRAEGEGGEAPAAAAAGPAERPAGARELVLHVAGMWCTACAWIIERTLERTRGVVEAEVLFASDLLRIAYLPWETSLERLAAAVRRLGYEISERRVAASGIARLRRDLLLRSGVALFLFMNIMVYSYVLYIGYFQELAPEMQRLAPLLLLGLTLPVIGWCAWPIYRRALAGLRARTPNMELLVSLSALAAFAYSLAALWRVGEHFYFDTAAGLVFLLLVGKLIEQSARRRATESMALLRSMLPSKVRLLTKAGERWVAVDRLQPGDR